MSRVCIQSGFPSFQRELPWGFSYFSNPRKSFLIRGRLPSGLSYKCSHHRVRLGVLSFGGHFLINLFFNGALQSSTAAQSSLFHFHLMIFSFPGKVISTPYLFQFLAIMFSSRIRVVYCLLLSPLIFNVIFLLITKRI